MPASGGVTSPGAATPQHGSSRQRLREETRWYGYLIGVAATYALLALALPLPTLTLALPVCLLAAVAFVVAAVLWRNASRMTRPGLWALAIAGTACATTAAALAAHRVAGTATVAALTRDQWLMAMGAVVIAAVVVRHLLHELRRRVTLLHRLARTDQLTGIPNRRSWDEELPRELARAARDRSPLSVAILDLDRFKLLNDMRGHQEGDDMLRRVARSWRDALRASDFIARYGGEEFAVIFRRCGLEEAIPIVERLRLAVPDEQTCSVGLSCWDGTESSDTLVRRADEALYAAKMAGRDRVKIARPSDGPLAVTPWAAIIKRLLEQRSVVAAYQPVVRLSDGAAVGYEALARPDRRHVDISVEAMFDCAQRLGLGRDLDWLCRRAALAGADWMGRSGLLFVNCGVSVLLDPLHRVDQTLLVLRSVGRIPSSVVLEVTERELIGDLNRLRQVVNTYRREGFRFAMDDVGEGHTTLEVLSVLEPEFVKIGRSLVVGSASRGPRAAVRAIVSFAHEIGAHVIAEGIEVEETAALMRHLGVGLAQGFLYGAPAVPSLPERFTAQAVAVAG